MPKEVIRRLVVNDIASPSLVSIPKGGNNPLSVSVWADKEIAFTAEYLPGTPSSEQGRARWITQPFDTNKKYTVKDQVNTTFGDVMGVKIPAKYCGYTGQVIEAFTVTPQNTHPTRIVVFGISKKKVIKTAWSLTKGGANITKGTPISYGDNVWLHIGTEGLNGATLDVEVYNQEIGTNKCIWSYTKVECINGEVNLLIKNTYAWRGKVSWIDVFGPETFYIKVKETRVYGYIPDDKGCFLHAVGLKIKDNISSRKIEPAANSMPLKIGENTLVLKRYEPCKYVGLTVKDGKALNYVLFKEDKKNAISFEPIDIIAGATENSRGNITLQFEDFNAIKCQQKEKHDKNQVEITSAASKSVLRKTISENKVVLDVTSGLFIEKDTDKLDKAVKLLPYIWPVNPAMIRKYNIKIKSCAYPRPFVLNVYPDIKWDFHFYLNLTNDLSVKWQKLSSVRLREMQHNAGKIGAEGRWKQTEVEMGVVLAAEWNRKGDKGDDSFDLTQKYEDKIKWLYKIFSSLKDIAKGITETTKGSITKTRLGKILPFSIEVKPPNFCIGAEWQVARGEKKTVATNKVGTAVKFYFDSNPIIALVLNIDLLSAAVTAAGTAVGNPEAGKIFDEIRDWLDCEDHAIRGKVYIDLLITGAILGKAELNINTASDNNKANVKLGTQLSAELQAGIELKGKIVVIGVEAYVDGELKASGKASVTFGHNLSYAGNDGLYYRPELKFDGLFVTLIIKAEAGLSIKKGIFNFDKHVNLADYSVKDKKLIDEFDVIKNLEEYSGVNANIPLIKNG